MCDFYVDRIKLQELNDIAIRLKQKKLARIE